MITETNPFFDSHADRRDQQHHAKRKRPAAPANVGVSDPADGGDPDEVKQTKRPSRHKTSKADHRVFLPLTRAFQHPPHIQRVPVCTPSIVERL